MKKISSLLLATFLLLQVLNAQTRYWVSATPANWSGNNWSSTSGGAPDGSGPPSGVESAEFDANGVGNCTVDAAANFTDLVVDGYTGTIDLNGNAFSVNGAADFSSGTINDTPGTSAVTISSTSIAVFSGTEFGAIVNCEAGGIDLDGSIFNADFTGVKVGNSTENGNGGNVFNGTFTLNYQSDGGRIRMGVNLPDTFNSDAIINSVSGGQIEFADNSADNYIDGNLEINLSDTSGNVIVSQGTLSTLAISGDLTVVHASTNSSNCYLGTNGSIELDGNLTYTNTSSGTNASLYIAENSGSAVTINGTTSITNNSTVTANARIYLGSDGDLIFNDQLEVTNNAVATNSYVYLNHSSNSSNQYNGNVLLNCNNALADGVLMGNNGGSGTLAAGFTLSEGGSGFSTSRLYLENLTQLGGTDQNINLTGSARLDIISCNFSADVDFTAPNLFYRESTFSGTADLSKTGSGTDDNYGGNRFEGDVTYTHSGSDRWLTANNVADTFNANVIIVSNGSGNFYLADDGGITSISGNLDVTIAGNAVNTVFANATNGALDVGGDLSIDNASSASISVYLGNNGDVTIGGDLSINNAGTAATSQLYIGNQENSSVNCMGKVFIDNTGGTSNGRAYFPNDGDLTVADSVILVNASPASNSQFYIGNRATSSVQFNGDVVISVDDASTDGFYFGSSNAAVTISSGENLTIGAAGFDNGELSLANLSKLGPETTNLSLSGTAILDVDNSTFGGDVSFSSPRIFIDGNTFSGQTVLTKTASGGDESDGANYFTSDLTINQSGTNYLRFGNTSPDSIMGNLTINISGTDYFQLARGSADNYVGGDLEVNISGTSGSPNLFLTGNTSSSLTIEGTTTLNESSSGTATVDHYLLNQGDGIFNDDIIINNASTTSASTQVWFSNSDLSTATINGNLTVNNTAATTEADVIIGDDGTVTITGNVDVVNDNTATNAEVFFANNATSSVIVGGNVSILNEGSGNNRNIYFGNNGDVTVDGDFSVENSSDATSSNIHMAYRSGSVGQFNGNIEIEATDAANDIIGFGDNGGTATLAAGQTLTIGAGGFLGGELRFENFIRTGATTTTLNCAGDTRIYSLDSDWQGDVSFIAPQILTEGSAYSGTTYLEKTGSNNNRSDGGNSFSGDLTLVNSGSAYLLMGDDLSDSCFANVLLQNTGSDEIYFAYNSTDNYIAGDLDIENLGTSDNTYIIVADISASSLSIGGNVSITNNGSSTNNDVRFGDAGEITLVGNLDIINNGTADNSQVFVGNGTTSIVNIGGDLDIQNLGGETIKRIYIADNGQINVDGQLSAVNTSSATTSDLRFANNSTSSLTIDGIASFTNSGSGNTSDFYIGNNGDITFNDDVSFSNTSGASNSAMYINHDDDSENTFNGSIEIENSNAAGEGVFFGEAGGSGTLAALETLTIGVGGFVAGDLYLRNFTRIGATATDLTCTGTARIYSYDSDWQGDVDFISPQVITRGSSFAGITYIEKTGATNSQSAGGNTFSDDVTLVNSGSDNLMMGNGTLDTYNANVTLQNTGSDEIYFAYNAAGQSIAGDLTIENLGTSGNTNIIVSDVNGTTLSIGGNVSITNNGSSTNNDVRLGDDGEVSIVGDLNITNTGTADNSDVIIGNGGNSIVTIGGNVDIQNLGGGSQKRVFLANSGQVEVNGTVDVTNTASAITSDIRIANNSSASAIIDGVSTFTNSGSGTTSVYYLGYQGDVTFEDNLFLSNTSGATTSTMYLNNRGNSSNMYNGSIEVENTDPSGDGITFGENGGDGTLAALETITIGAGGFVAGDLQFRNFTRTGATTTSLTCSGTARIYSYYSDWQGDVNFIAPQIITRGSSYAGVSYLEKNGANNDQSAGGNSFSDDVTFVNSGSGYLMMGNGTLDTYGANVNLENSGSSNIYFAYNAAGQSIAGDLDIMNLGSSGNTTIIVSDGSSSTLSIGGNVTITNNGTSTNNDVILGDAGDISISGNLTIENDGSANASEVYVANGGLSFVQVNGNLELQNTGGGTTKRSFIADAGQVYIGGQLTVQNNATANISQCWFADNASSAITVIGVASIINSASGNDSRMYVGDNGDINFENDLFLSNTSGASSSRIYLNYDNSSLNTYNGSIEVENTNASGDGISFGQSAGVGNLAAGETISVDAGGFIAGDLYFRNFTQQGASAQTLTLSGSSRFFSYESEFDGSLTVSAPRIYNRTSTFNQDVSFTKTGSTNEFSYGGNTFNGNLSFTVDGTGYQAMANNQADDYNGDLTLVQNGSGYFRPTYNRDCTLSGDLYYDLSTQTRFGDAGGSIIFDGTTDQSINDLGASTVPYFEKLTVDKTSGDLTLNTPIIIAGFMSLSEGLVNTDQVNTLTFFDNTSVVSASDQSHVVGPVNKIGNDDFNFPVGNGIQHRPIGIARVTSGSAEFQATYVDSSANSLYSLAAKEGSLDHLSNEEYWILDRLASTAEAEVILSWDTASGGVNVLSELRIARWNGAQWVDEGNASFTGSTTTGTLTSGARVADFSPFTLGSSSENNPLPVELISFYGLCEGGQMKLEWETATELNNDYFQLYASSNGLNFYEVAKVKGNGNSSRPQFYQTYVAGDYQYFYLAQTDFDGTRKEYSPKQFKSCQAEMIFTVYPNPIEEGNLIILASDKRQELTIRNATGELVYQKLFVGSLKLNRSRFAKGVYFIQLSDGAATAVQKLIVK